MKYLSIEQYCVCTDQGEHDGDLATHQQRQAVAAGATHQCRYFDELIQEIPLRMENMKTVTTS